MANMNNYEAFSATHIECLIKSIEMTFSFNNQNSLKFSNENNDSTLWMNEGIVGIISLVGDLSWSVSLGLPKKTAIIMAKQFTGFEINFDSEDMDDVTGELINVLAGDIISKLDTVGTSVNMSLPIVARGNKMGIHVPDRLPKIQLHCTTNGESFAISLTSGKFHQRRKNRSLNCI